MPTMRCLSMVSSPRLSGTEQPVLALSVLRCRSPAPASYCLRCLRQGRGFMPAAGTQNMGTALLMPAAGSTGVAMVISMVTGYLSSVIVIPALSQPPPVGKKGGC